MIRVRFSLPRRSIPAIAIALLGASMMFLPSAPAAPSDDSIVMACLDEGSSIPPDAVTAQSVCGGVPTVATPVVGAVVPATGPTVGGTIVVINGNHLEGVTAVTFGGVESDQITVNSDQQLEVLVPANGIGTVDVVVTGQCDSGTLAGSFTYDIAPSVTAIAPSTGSTAGGTSVVVSGTGFTSATAVGFAGTPASSFTVVSDTQIDAVAPARSAGAADVTVTGPYGTSATSSADEYTFADDPTVASLSPAAGPTAGGTTVTISGGSFAGATGVTFGSTPATSFTVLSSTEITAVSPASSAGTYDVTVTTAIGTSTTSPAGEYTFVAAPTITSLTPSSGEMSGGETVTILGTNFTDPSTVTFDGLQGTNVVVVSANQITVTTPAHTLGMVNVVVATPGGSATAINGYDYVLSEAAEVGIPAERGENQPSVDCSGPTTTTTTTTSTTIPTNDTTTSTVPSESTPTTAVAPTTAATTVPPSAPVIDLRGVTPVTVPGSTETLAPAASATTAPPTTAPTTPTTTPAITTTTTTTTMPTTTVPRRLPLADEPLIRGSVFDDENRNGVQDPGERSRLDLVARLYRGNRLLETQGTPYAFNGRSPGSYVVRFFDRRTGRELAHRDVTILAGGVLG